VNLTGFEQFFDERRPFFTEGNQLLRGSGPSYFTHAASARGRRAMPAGTSWIAPRMPRSWVRPKSPGVWPADVTGRARGGDFARIGTDL